MNSLNYKCSSKLLNYQYFGMDWFQAVAEQQFACKMRDAIRGCQPKTHQFDKMLPTIMDSDIL